MAMPPPAQDGQGAAAGGDQGGGDIASFLTQTDSALLKIATAIQKSPQAPPEAKKGFADALTAFRSALTALTGEGGEGEGQAPAGGSTTPEQGGNPGAVPVTQGRPA